MTSVAPGDRGQEQELFFLSDPHTLWGPAPQAAPRPRAWLLLSLTWVPAKASGRGRLRLLGVLGGVLLPFSGPWLEQNLPTLAFCPNACRQGGRRLATLFNKLPKGASERRAGLGHRNVCISSSCCP